MAHRRGQGGRRLESTPVTGGGLLSLGGADLRGARPRRGRPPGRLPQRGRARRGQPRRGRPRSGPTSAGPTSAGPTSAGPTSAGPDPSARISSARPGGAPPPDCPRESATGTLGGGPVVSPGWGRGRRNRFGGRAATGGRESPRGRGPLGDDDELGVIDGPAQRFRRGRPRRREPGPQLRQRARPGPRRAARGAGAGGPIPSFDDQLLLGCDLQPDALPDAFLPAQLSRHWYGRRPTRPGFALPLLRSHKPRRTQARSP